MVERSTIKNNSTEKNLNLLDSMAWRSKWNGEYFEEVRGFENYFNEAEMIIEELKNRNIQVKFYEDLWKQEKERIKLRAENYEEYKRKYELTN